MKQKALFLLLAFTFLLPAHIFAFVYKYKGVILSYTIVDTQAKTCIVDGYKNFSGEVIIPEVASTRPYDYSVVGIGEGAFKDNKDMTSVVIPNSVTYIGSDAFHKCINLTSVTIPNSVTKIGYSAFHNCINLTSVDIPNSVTLIEPHAFTGCRGLTSVDIPSAATSIGAWAFLDCSGLTSIDIPNSITSIGPSAFAGCRGLTSVVIPSSVLEIQEWAFGGCENLDSIIIGHGIKDIGDYVFSNCPASNIYITAQTPPKITTSTFSNYSGLVHLQGKEAVNAYANDEYWGRFNFNNVPMTKATSLKFEGMTSISGNLGDTFQLNTRITPVDVTLPYVFWRSTNPKIATVDNKGLVTLQKFVSDDQTIIEGDEEFYETCKIIAETLYFDGPVTEVTVYNSGIDAVETITDNDNLYIDYSQPYDVYNINGLKVGESTDGLSKGFYVIRQSNAAVKTVVK